MPPRKQAFSGKQKKEQLKEKRAKKGGGGGGRDNDDSGSDNSAADEHASPVPTRDDVATATLGGDKKGIRSAFIKESDKEIRARKRLSYLPLTDRRANPAIPFGEWFKMAFEGNVDELDDIECPFERQARLATMQRPAASEGHAVYQWKDAPVGLPLPLPCDDAILHGPGHKLSPVEVEALKTAEAAQYKRWLKTMAQFEGRDAGGINQYEQNLDVWRQLWFTVEHSEVVLIIADCRYPAFHIPISLVRFVIVNRKRKLLVVLNKADLVPQAILDAWTVFLRKMITEFLQRENVANIEKTFDIVPMCATPDAFAQDVGDGEKFGAARRKVNKVRRKQADYRQQAATLAEELEAMNLSGSGSDDDDDDDDAGPAVRPTFKGAKGANRDEDEHAREEKIRLEKYAAVGRAINVLLERCHALGGKPVSSPTPLSIGFIGHPNVGKSSLINAIKGMKTVSVSATPGHTKHMQTVNLPDENAVLYDCPGLCFPSLGVPRPLQAVLGTHQIAQQRDPASGVGFLARHLQLEKMYGLKKLYDDEPHWSAHEFCEAYAIKRGYRTRGKGGGAPDVHRGAIAILQEAYAGRLVLYFVPPPLEKAAELAVLCDNNVPIVDE